MNDMLYRIKLLLAAFLVTGALTGQQTENLLLLKARAMNKAGKTDDVINLLSGTIENTGDSRLYLERGEAYLRKKDFSAAIGDFQSACKIDQSSGEFGLARTYALKGDAATAMYHLGLSMKSPYRKSEKEILLDRAFSTIENSNDWRQFWKKDWYSSFERSASELEYNLSVNNIGEAKTILSGMDRQYPGSEINDYCRSLIYLAEKNYNDAIRLMSKLADEHPENEKYLLGLANAQLESGNRAGASSTYTKLLGNGSSEAGLYLKRAECYRKTGETEKALSDVVRYLEICPEDKNAISLAGRLEAESGDNLKALSFFNKNLSLYPDDPSCYIDRANSYFISKSWEHAIKDYSMSLDLKPSDNEVWLNKGLSLLNSGKKDDACHDFRQSFKLGNKKAAEYINRNCL
jgi:tetratricopeptide (TPR) repeat protein